MISVREWLISVLTNDFNKIKIINGYNYDVKAVYPAFVDINTHNLNEFPVIWFEIIENPYNNSKSISRRTRDTFLQIKIGGYVEYNNSASISYFAEKLITDILCCLYKVFPQSTVLDTLKTNIQWDIKSIDPYLDPNSENKAEIRTMLEINYEDSIDLLRTINTDLPTIPVISAPTNGNTVTTNQPNITWGSVSSALTYYLQVSTNNTFGSLIVNQQYINETGYTINSNDALSNGIYYTRVKAFNNNGYSDWSSTVSFIVDADAVITPLEWNQISGVISYWNTFSSTGLTISSGSISAMKDQINTRNLTQGTAGARPTLSGNAWGSLSSAYFNPTFGSDSRVLAYNDSSAVYKWDNSTTGSFMIMFMVDGRNYDYNSGYYCPFGRTNTNYGGQMALVRGVNTGPGSYQLGYPYANLDYMVVPTALNVPHMLVFTHSGSATTIYLDGIKLGTHNRSLTNFAVEANSYFNLGQYYVSTYTAGQFTGHIFGAGHATASLTSGQIASLQLGFTNKFGL